jgi:hypothetical protein
LTQLLLQKKKETKAVLHYFTRFLEPLFRELKKEERNKKGEETLKMFL